MANGGDERVAGAVDDKADAAVGVIEPEEGPLAPVQNTSLASETEVRGSNQSKSFQELIIRAIPCGCSGYTGGFNGFEKRASG